MPEVSVILPFFNGRPYLDKAIRSILSQSFERIELVLVDDGSTDGSLRLAKQYKAIDPRVRVLSRKNTGIVGALNDGLTESRGEKIARMDADDISYRMRLEKQRDWMNEHEECVLLGTQIEHIDPHGLPLRRSPLPIKHEEIEELLLKGIGGAIAHPSAMMLREGVKAVGGYQAEAEYVEDLDLFLRMAEVGEIGNLEAVHLGYRVHPKSLNARKHEAQERLKKAIVRKAYERRGRRMPEGWCADQCDQSIEEGTYNWWAWNALGLGRHALAIEYAAQSWRKNPRSPEPLKVIICAIRSALRRGK